MLEGVTDALRRLGPVRGLPVYARRAHVAFAWAGGADAPAPNHPHIESLRVEGGYLNGSLGDAFFSEAIAAGLGLPPVGVNPRWSEEAVFDLPLYAALRPSGAGEMTGRGEVALSAAQKMAFVAVAALPCEKDPKGRCVVAARLALEAFDADSGAAAAALARLLYAEAVKYFEQSWISG